VPESTQHVTFYFDPICPWAYRTSLWVREARKVRPLEIEWRFLSLMAVNRGSERLKDVHEMSINPFRVMAFARRGSGLDVVDRLYLEAGSARHDRNENIADAAVLETLVANCGLDPALVAQALEDESTMTDVEADHQTAIEMGSFGVPTIELDHDRRGYFGPVISQVPEGEPAGEMWDHFAWMIQQPYFYEIKRER
jgi:predicted DsbA family dithiol-disulfide isomerase